MFWMLMGGAALLVLVTAGVLIPLLGANRTKVIAPHGTASAGGDGKEALPPARGDSEVLSEAEPLAGRFLQAKRIEEMLPLIRNPDLVGGRMRGFYPGGVITPEGLGAFNTLGEPSHVGSAFAVRLRTKNYEEKTMFFFQSPEGLKVDWESWVGWSEVLWQDFQARKPETPKLFRVRLGEVEYYNPPFSDDKIWKSFRLLSPDRENAIYGYVERGSVLNSRLVLPPDAREAEFTLTLKFPENPRAGNQVIIDRIIADSWVVENENSR